MEDKMARLSDEDIEKYKTLFAKHKGSKEVVISQARVSRFTFFHILKGGYCTREILKGVIKVTKQVLNITDEAQNTGSESPGSIVERLCNGDKITITFKKIPDLADNLLPETGVFESITYSESYHPVWVNVSQTRGTRKYLMTIPLKNIKSIRIK